MIPASYLDVIRQRHPDVGQNRLVANHDGMVNDVVIVDGDEVFRFAKDDWARERLAIESAVLEFVRPHVRIDVPQFIPVSDGAVSYKFLPGEALSSSILKSAGSAEREILVQQLAQFIDALHGLDVSRARSAGVPDSDANRTRSDWLLLHERLQHDLYPHLMPFQREWIDNHFQPIVDDSLSLEFEPTFIHGDLGEYHLLCDPQRSRLTGCIDFGTAGIGDPATDVATILGNYGDRIAGEIIAASATLSAHVERARFWVGTLPLQWALIGRDYPHTNIQYAHIGRYTPDALVPR